MENHIHLTQPSNLNKYVEEFNTKMKEEFSNSLTKIYNDDMKKYDDIINIIIQLPFVKRIIEENNSLREKLNILGKSSDDTEPIKLEISDKPVTTSYIDLDKISFSQNEKTESSDSSDDTSSDEEEDEDGKLPLHFEYDIVDNCGVPKEEFDEEFFTLIGDILVDIIVTQGEDIDDEEEEDAI